MQNVVYLDWKLKKAMSNIGNLRKEVKFVYKDIFFVIEKDGDV